MKENSNLKPPQSDWVPLRLESINTFGFTLSTVVTPIATTIGIDWTVSLLSPYLSTYQIPIHRCIWNQCLDLFWRPPNRCPLRVFVADSNPAIYWRKGNQFVAATSSLPNPSVATAPTMFSIRPMVDAPDTTKLACGTKASKVRYSWICSNVGAIVRIVWNHFYWIRTMLCSARFLRWNRIEFPISLDFANTSRSCCCERKKNVSK